MFFGLQKNIPQAALSMPAHLDAIVTSMSILCNQYNL